MGVVERSREVMAVMALHEALRNVCTNSDWTYSVFWTIRPRPRLRGGGSGCKAGDEGSLMLMWEDGYCRPAPTSEAAAAAGGSETLVHEGLHRVHSSNSLNLGDDVEEEDPVRKAFRKMSIQLYNYGEGLMGKVASDKCHKWVFRESSETEVGPLNYWQSSFDSHPPEWIDQFSAGIQTIAVIQAGHGLLQLGSCKIVAEDLHFVLRMRYTFESLENQAGGFLSQTFAPMRNRFFCGSPTGTAPAAVASAATAWPNGQASAFFQSSDFRLRLGVSSDSPAAAAAINSQDFLRSSSTGNDENITSLRLSLQNGSAGDRPLSFEFRNPEHDGDGGAAANSGCQGLSGMKRPAGSPLVSGAGAGAARSSSLLARRMQYNKMNHHHHLDDNSTTFQQLLEGNHNAFSSPQTAVFLTNNGTTNSNNLDHHHHHHHEELMVQIPPVIATNNTSPMISPMLSPGGSSKIQRSSGNSNVSPLIQAALQEAMERSSSQQQPRSGSSSHPGTPKPPSEAAAPSRSHFAGSHPSTPNNVNSDHHFMNSASAASHPGTPRLNSAATEMHFLSSNSGSHPGTPNKHSAATAAAADNYLNNANGCLVDHSSASTMMISSNGTGSNHDKPDPLHIPAAAWENLKESLEMPSSNRRPSSGDMYPDFMESFFE